MSEELQVRCETLIIPIVLELEKVNLKHKTQLIYML